MFDPLQLLTPHRTIRGISAILLPFQDERIDWDAFERHVARTREAGLVPAVNMDTGYIQKLDGSTRREVLARTRGVVGVDEFVAGACVVDEPGAAWDRAAYVREMAAIVEFGGTPVVFPSYGLNGLAADRLIAALQELARVGEFIGFELGKMFDPRGRIYEYDTYARLLEIPECTGAKHSSLNRQLEWDRLELRNRLRPEFHVYTGNDLAIDMPMYGSDYLLGLSTCAPDLFARRDRAWAQGDPEFYELNDALQALGWFAFRPPTPAYKHTCAQFLKIRGWLASDEPHPTAPRRPNSDVPILETLWQALERFA